MRRVLELFSGNGDITKELNSRGFKCESVDYDPRYNATHCVDVYTLSDEFLKQYDFIWLSPDCTTYSFAAHGIHRRKGNIAVSDYAKECDANNAKLFKRLIDLDIPFIAENPRAFMRQADFVKDLYRCTVYYSTYGTPYSKPTDLFSNRPIEQYFDTRVNCTGVQLDYVCKSYSKFLDRCKMPTKLIEAIVYAVTNILIIEEFKKLLMCWEDSYMKYINDEISFDDVEHLTDKIIDLLPFADNNEKDKFLDIIASFTDPCEVIDAAMNVINTRYVDE